MKNEITFRTLYFIGYFSEIAKAGGRKKKDWVKNNFFFFTILWRYRLVSWWDDPDRRFEFRECICLGPHFRIRRGLRVLWHFAADAADESRIFGARKQLHPKSDDISSASGGYTEGIHNGAPTSCILIVSLPQRFISNDTSKHLLSSLIKRL